MRQLWHSIKAPACLSARDDLVLRCPGAQCAIASCRQRPRPCRNCSSADGQGLPALKSRRRCSRRSRLMRIQPDGPTSSFVSCTSSREAPAIYRCSPQRRPARRSNSPCNPSRKLPLGQRLPFTFLISSRVAGYYRANARQYAPAPNGQGEIGQRRQQNTAGPDRLRVRLRRS